MRISTSIPLDVDEIEKCEGETFEEKTDNYFRKCLL